MRHVLSLLMVLGLLIGAAPLDAYDQVETTWVDFKIFKTRDSFTAYYIEHPQGTEPETFLYTVFGANTSFYFKCGISESADITDFEANFKTAAQVVGSESEAVGRSRVPISKTGALTTNNATALQTVLTYTVPTKQTFHLEQWMVGRVNAGNAEMTLAQLQVNGTPVDGQSNQSLTGAPFYEREYAHPLPLAVAGDVITIKITPNATAATIFGARLVGELR